MIVRVSHPTKTIKGEINLGSSKSESNRILMIRAISGLNICIENLSSSQDTQTLLSILNVVKNHSNTKQEESYNVGHAGTTMRFLTAFFSCLDGTRILTGSERMQQRPIGELVDALRKLGADIEYLGKKGYPPLKINGGTLHGGSIEIEGGISSQFISALLMISPLLHRGLAIKFKGDVVSKPYINMTLNMMEMYGVVGNWENNTIFVTQQKYGVHVSKQKYSFDEEGNNVYHVEGDWSSASYLYAIAALSKEAEIKINGLRPVSFQGDAITSSVFDFFSVHTTWLEKTMLLNKTTMLAEQFQYNFEDCPDIAQTLAVVASGLKVPAVISGLKTLRVKETDRIRALNNELSKFKVSVTELGDEGMKIDPLAFNAAAKVCIETYHDHRMAMCFAPLALICEYVDIENPSVVEKSYPAYWDDLRKLGFKIDEL